MSKRTVWFNEAVAILAENGHIEVNIVPTDLGWFGSEYNRRVGRPPDPDSYNVAQHPEIKGGSQLRIVLDSQDLRDKAIVERGLGVSLRKGQGGKGFRKGSKKVCLLLIEAGLDIGRRPPHKRIPSLRELEVQAKQWEQNAEEYLEGFRKEITHEVAMRNRKVVDAAKRMKGYSCVVCGFNFSEFYGPQGEGFIEGHHRAPVANYRRAHRIRPSDIEPVCANCHRMLHRGTKLLTIDQLKQMIRKQGSVRHWPWHPVTVKKAE